VTDLEKTRLDAEKEQRELFTEKTRLQDKLRKIQPGFTSMVRNLPILDLANPSLKVNQIITANLQDDVIFTGTPKVDRCTTCHLGIDKKGYEDAAQPFTTHPNMDLYLAGPHPVERVGCTVCHQGRGAPRTSWARCTPLRPRIRRRPGASTRTRKSTSASTIGTCR
jgi:hypothetical protein